MAISANLVRGSFGFGLEGDMARAGRWLIGGPLVGNRSCFDISEPPQSNQRGDDQLGLQVVVGQRLWDNRPAFFWRGPA